MLIRRRACRGIITRIEHGIVLHVEGSRDEYVVDTPQFIASGAVVFGVEARACAISHELLFGTMITVIEEA